MLIKNITTKKHFVHIYGKLRDFFYTKTVTIITLITFLKIKSL